MWSPTLLDFGQGRTEFCVWSLVGKASLGMWLLRGLCGTSKRTSPLEAIQRSKVKCRQCPCSAAHKTHHLCPEGPRAVLCPTSYTTSNTMSFALSFQKHWLWWMFHIVSYSQIVHMFNIVFSNSSLSLSKVILPLTRRHRGVSTTYWPGRPLPPFLHKSPQENNKQMSRMGTAPRENSQALEQAGIIALVPRLSEKRAGLSLTVPVTEENQKNLTGITVTCHSNPTTYYSTHSLTQVWTHKPRKWGENNLSVHRNHNPVGPVWVTKSFLQW